MDNIELDELTGWEQYVICGCVLGYRLPGDSDWIGNFQAITSNL